MDGSRRTGGDNDTDDDYDNACVDCIHRSRLESVMGRVRSVGRGCWVLAVSMALLYLYVVAAMLRGGPSPSSSSSSSSSTKGQLLRGRLRSRGSSSSSGSTRIHRSDVPAQPDMSGLQHLVVVAGHAVTVTESLENVEKDDAVWYLLPYQRHQDLPGALVAHIRSGVELAAKDPAAVVVFSGGQTRADAGPKSEGVSYFHVAEHFNWWGAPHGQEVKERAAVEEFATDSFENLLYSICRFKEFTGHYPRDITVVSFAFKQERFESLHRAALRFPKARFHYVGVDPPADSRFDLEAARKGEYENAVKLFKGDPYGCHSPLLQQKRLERNPFRRTVPYTAACPEIAELLEWCDRTVYPDTLPWDAY